MKITANTARATSATGSYKADEAALFFKIDRLARGTAMLAKTVSDIESAALAGRDREVDRLVSLANMMLEYLTDTLVSAAPYQPN